MATETLRPDAPGAECNISQQTGVACPNHYLNVDEVVSDEGTTKVFSQNSGYERDLYNVEDHSVGSGTINFVKIYARCSKSNNGLAKICIQSGGVPDEGDPIALEHLVWVTYDETWATPPEGGSWTWAKIDALQAGVSLDGAGAKGDQANCCQLYVEVDYTAIVLPTVTTQAASSVEDTTATGNGNITNNGGEDCDIRGIVWDLASQGAPGNVAPGASGYANDVPEANGFGVGAFTRSLTGLPTGDVIYARAYAHNSAGYAYGAEVNFLTKPAAPANVAATDGVHTDKVVITWDKSTGATGYKVYEGANLLDTLGDVATYDDNAALAPTITPGTASASDGTSSIHVALSLAGESTSVGTSRTYKVVALNATGDSDDSDTDTGYRGVGALTYQWQRSAADSDAGYGNIAGATTDPYDDTGAPGNGQGRWYLCLLDATGATQGESTHDRGYRWMGEKTAHMGAKMVAGKI